MLALANNLWPETYRDNKFSAFLGFAEMERAKGLCDTLLWRAWKVVSGRISMREVCFQSATALANLTKVGLRLLVYLNARFAFKSPYTRFHSFGSSLSWKINFQFRDEKLPCRVGAAL